ncbi:DDE-type integrase/transposase/recombinase [Staphylococcus agnetis]|uniref:DDE-type integrase/transposase/recombinase n=1 Tax=Staphylococcus agnetis TaxID=985762 RepID=UPI003B82F4AB
MKNINTKLYLSLVIDVFSKEIFAYSVSKNPTLDLALSSLDKAIRNIPKLNYRTTVHSSQGGTISVDFGWKHLKIFTFLKHIKER